MSFALPQHRDTVRSRCRSLLPALTAVLTVTLVVGVTACAPAGMSRTRVAAPAATVPRIWYGTDDPTERTWSQE